MLQLAALLVATSVMLFVIAVGSVAGTRPRAVRARLRGVRSAGLEGDAAPGWTGRARLEALLQEVGERIVKPGAPRETTGELLERAGYLRSNALAIYTALRVLMTFGLGIFVGMLTSFLGSVPGLVMMAAGIAGMAGWTIPRVFVARRGANRRKEIQRALPDALDLMVVCVEAGMGLNQALLHVTQEIGPVSGAMREELALVNLEIQTGTPRDEALRHFADRTDLADIRSLVAMLVQTDRFGTSIARSFRAHADAMRAKRRQRAEESAAKTTIKLVFPLVLFIFPAMFVVILGPALLHIIEQLRGVS